MSDLLLYFTSHPSLPPSLLSPLLSSLSVSRALLKSPPRPVYPLLIAPWGIAPSSQCKLLNAEPTCPVPWTLKYLCNLVEMRSAKEITTMHQPGGFHSQLGKRGQYNKLIYPLVNPGPGKGGGGGFGLGCQCTL
jgi:hypothetical protein